MPSHESFGIFLATAVLLAITPGLGSSMYLPAASGVGEAKRLLPPWGSRLADWPTSWLRPLVSRPSGFLGGGLQPREICGCSQFR